MSDLTLRPHLLAMALLAFPGPLAAQNLVVKGGFEQPSPVPGGISIVTPLVTGTKQAGSSVVPVGGSVTYTIILRNLGQQTQTDNPGDEFVDVLPGGLLLQSASATSGTLTPSFTGDSLHWSGSIPGGGMVTITLQAGVGAVPVGTSLSNQGSIFFDGDGNGTNESTSSTDDPTTPAVSDATRVRVVPDSIVEMPTLSGWGLAAFALLLAAGAWRVFARMQCR